MSHPLLARSAIRTTARFGLVLAPLLAVLHVPAAALAEPPPARDAAAAEVLFRDGLAARDKGDWATACLKLDASMSLDPSPSTLINIARCNEHEGKLATAWAQLQRALELNRETAGAQRKKDLDDYARGFIAGIEPRLPRLTIVVRERPAGLRVTRGGVEIPLGALGTALPANPGTQEIEATAPGRAPARQTVTLVEGKAATVELVVTTLRPEGPPPTPPTPIAVGLPPVASTEASTRAIAPPPAGPSGRRTGAYVAGGIGLAGVVVGAVAGGFMLGDRSVVSASCTPGSGRTSVCTTAAAVTAGNDAKTAGLAASVGWVTAVAGLATGTVLFVTEPRGKPARTGRWSLSAGPSPRIEGTFTW